MVEFCGGREVVMYKVYREGRMDVWFVMFVVRRFRRVSFSCRSGRSVL